jgi:hypothetical protein
MATYVPKNNAVSTLAGNINATATSITVYTGQGVRFPTINNGGVGTDYTIATLQNTAGTVEIVTIVRHDTGSDSMTIGVAGTTTGSVSGRAQEGTSAASWVIGDVVDLRMTAGILDEKASVTGTQTITNKTLTSPVVTGAPTAAGATWADLGTVSDVNITGGDIAGITDLAVADGGTGRSTGTTAYALVATGTTATGAQQTLAAGATTEVLVGGGAAALPVWTTASGSGAPVRQTNATLVNPALGTPASGVLTNCTGFQAFPVGSVFMAVVATNPSTLLGYGSWAAFGAGRMPIGIDSGNALFDAAEETGGSANSVVVSHTHTATVNDPGHVHSFSAVQQIGGSYLAFSSTGQQAVSNTDSATTGITVGMSTDGVSGTNANYPPFIAVYMWKRTA